MTLLDTDLTDPILLNPKNLKYFCIRFVYKLHIKNAMCHQYSSMLQCFNCWSLRQYSVHTGKEYVCTLTMKQVHSTSVQHLPPC